MVDGSTYEYSSLKDDDFRHDFMLTCSFTVSGML